MASAYSISATFSLIDKITNPLNRINKSGTRAADALKKSYMAAEKRINAFGELVKSKMIYAQLALVGSAGAVVGVTTRQFIDFDDAVTKSGALFADTQNLKGDAFKSALKDIGAEARKVAAATEFNAIDTAGALQKMAMAGMSAKTSMELLRGTTDLATAAGTDLTTAVDIATDTLGALGMAATDKNLQRVSDVMAKTASTFNTDLQPMFEAITYAGPTFTTAGQSIDVLSASIGVLANAGIKGSSAGTALNAVFTQLSSDKKQNALGKLGIQTKNAEGNFLNLFDIVGQLQGKLAGMGNAQKSAILTEIFDTRGAKAMNILLGAGVDELKRYENVLRESGGAAADMANIMRGSLKNQIEVLKSGLMELGFKFVETFQQKGSEIIGKLTNAINSIDISSLTAKVSDGIAVVENLIGILWRFKDVIGFVLSAIFLYKTAMNAWVIYSSAAAVITGILNGAQIAYASIVLKNTAATSAMAFAEGTAASSAGFFAFFLKLASKSANTLRNSNIGATASIVALTVAQWNFNGAAAANPIGLIIMAIAVAVAALIALIVLVVKNWDKITEAVTRAFVWLKAFFVSFGGSIKKVIEPIINWFKSKWSSVAEFFKSVWEGAVSFLKNLWNTVTSVFNGIWNGIAERVASVANWFGGVWQTVTGAFAAAWTWVSDLFSSIWDGIKSKISAFVDWLKPVIDAIVSVFKPIVNFIGSVFSDAVDAGDAALAAYDKANKKTNETAFVVEEASPPTASSSYAAFDASAFGVDPAAYGSGALSYAGSKSKLHGVVDISGGASIPGLDNAPTRTAAGGVSSAGGTATENAAVISILNVVKRIDTNVAQIVRSASAPSTSVMSPSFPPMYLGGDDESGSADYTNPRTMAPVTQGERMAHSLQERRETVAIEVSAARGTDARITKAPRNIDIELVSSGGNYG